MARGPVILPKGMSISDNVTIGVLVRCVPARIVDAGQSGEARIFLIQDDNLTAEVPLRRSILQSTLRQKYRSTGRHNPQRDGGPEKGLYRLHPIALIVDEVLKETGRQSLRQRSLPARFM